MSSPQPTPHGKRKFRPPNACNKPLPNFTPPQTVLASPARIERGRDGEVGKGNALICGPPLARFLLLFLACFCPAGAQAEGADGTGQEKIETEHIFGFTEGTDIGEKGEQEFEATTVARLGNPGSHRHRQRIRLPQRDFRRFPALLQRFAGILQYSRHTWAAQSQLVERGRAFERAAGGKFPTARTSPLVFLCR